MNNLNDLKKSLKNSSTNIKKEFIKTDEGNNEVTEMLIGYKLNKQFMKSLYKKSLYKIWYNHTKARYERYLNIECNDQLTHKIKKVNLLLLSLDVLQNRKIQFLSPIILHTDKQLIKELRQIQYIEKKYLYKIQ